MANTVAVGNKTTGNRYLALVDQAKKLWTLFPMAKDYVVGIPKDQLEDAAIMFFDNMDDVETFASEAMVRGFHRHDPITKAPEE